MSACESGLGKEFSGGLFGLGQAWYSAGAGQVVMSLWSIDDAGAKTLMRELVSEVAGAKAEPSRLAYRALGNAMRKIKRSHVDPAIWAAFVAFGGVEQ